MEVPCEVPHTENMSEADVKLENEELRKEIVILKDENLIMKALNENQKKTISSLNNLVSHLRKENSKIKADLKNHQKSKSGDYFVNKLKLGTISEPVASSKKKIKVSPKKLSNRYFQTKEFKEYWRQISKERFDFSELGASQNDGEESFQSQPPKKNGRCVNARKQSKMLSQTNSVPFDVSKLEDSLNNSSSCSVSERKSPGRHKRDHEGFLVPLTRVKFTIVTEEKDGAGRTIPSLACAMRPETFIRQVKKSYCKKMGLDRDRMDLKLVGDVNQNMMDLMDTSSVQGLEGRVLAAVRVCSGMGELSSEVASKNIGK